MNLSEARVRFASKGLKIHWGKMGDAVILRWHHQRIS